MNVVVRDKDVVAAIDGANHPQFYRHPGPAAERRSCVQ